MRKLIIVGAGGHGCSIAEAAMLLGHYQITGFIDDRFPELSQVLGLPVIGPMSRILDFLVSVDEAFVAIGNNNLRAEVQTRLSTAGFKLATIIHPRAFVSPSAVLGAGTAIMAGAIVGTEAQLGNGVIVNCGAVVDHHCKIGDFGHMGVNASMAGGSHLGNAAWMQAGSSLGYGVKIIAGTILCPGEAIRQC